MMEIVLKLVATLGGGDVITFLIIYFTQLHMCWVNTTALCKQWTDMLQ